MKHLIFCKQERGSRGWAVPLAVSVLRSPSRLLVSPDGTRQQEEGRRGRSRPHFIIFVYTIKSSTKAYNMADKHQIVRRNHYRYHLCKLSVDGHGSQASIWRQNRTLQSAGKITDLYYHLNRFSYHLRHKKKIPDALIITNYCN